MDVLQKLYDSEINASIGWVWDGGFEVRLGDDMNGVVAETNVPTIAEADEWLRAKAIEHYPDSAFAKSA